MEETKAIRDPQGRLVQGHGGLRKPGITNKLSREIKQSLGDFLKGKLSTAALEELYTSLSNKEKSRLLTELLPYILPRQKELAISGELATGPRIKQDLSKLTPDELRIFLKAHEILSPGEEPENEDEQ